MPGLLGVPGLQDTVREVSVAEHHALGLSGGSRSIDNRRQRIALGKRFRAGHADLGRGADKAEILDVDNGREPCTVGIGEFGQLGF